MRVVPERRERGMQEYKLQVDESFTSDHADDPPLSSLIVSRSRATP